MQWPTMAVLINNYLPFGGRGLKDPHVVVRPIDVCFTINLEIIRVSRSSDHGRVASKEDAHLVF